jgi:DNA primase
VEANKAAAAYYREQLAGADAEIGRRFLTDRGFDAEAAERFGLGFAPRGWDGLTKHLRGKQFTEEELLTAGLVVRGQRGIYDRFRGRLLWTIRDNTGDPIGFGARKLYDDDDGPKYLNTPETPAYKKSEVLYGIDLAKREIARQQRAVIVEGYTDVMAAHLAGVPTAVATCGTAFGPDHARVLRRLLLDAAGQAGEVVFTFDGDEAGRKAAIRAFERDPDFVAQTFVAIAADGLDPCDLRLQRGDAAVVELVESRTPLVEFVIRSTLADYDLRHAEGRIAALKATAPLLTRIRDSSLRPEYARQLAGWLGVDVAQVTAAAAAHREQPKRSREVPAAVPAVEPLSGPVGPDPADRSLFVDRESCKLVLQRPDLIGDRFDELPSDAFAHPGYDAVSAAVRAVGGAAAATPGANWLAAVRDAADSDAARSLITALAVEPILADDDVVPRYATEQLDRLADRALERRIVDVKATLERLPVDGPDYQEVFAELLALEQQRRAIRDRAMGVG